MNTSLAELIDAYRKARAAWDAIDTDGNCDGPEWDAYYDAEVAVLKFPCSSLADVQSKARFALENRAVYDTLQSCHIEEGDALAVFLRSLAGEACK